MSRLAVVISSVSPEVLHTMLSMLLFQRVQDLSVYVLETGSGLSAVTEQFDARLKIRLFHVLPEETAPASAAALVKDEEFVLFMDPSVSYGKKAFRRMLRCISAHPDHDVWHWNCEGTPKYPRRISDVNLFKKVLFKGYAAPLASFVLRVSAIKALGGGAPGLGLLLALGKERRIRTVWWEKVQYAAPALPDSSEEAVRRRLAFFRWSENYFSEEYPVGVSERLALICKELARLYPERSEAELKEELFNFAVVSGPIRKIKATNALKAALKARTS